jgi:hypothetical protein
MSSTPFTERVTDSTAPATTPTPGWWPKEHQADWRALPTSDFGWLVVWNVNTGGGKDAFAVHNGYWGDHPFRPGDVPEELAYVWHADEVSPPSDWSPVRSAGGIISQIGLRCRGVPTYSGIVLAPSTDDRAALQELIAIADDEVRAAGGAWCRALLGTATTHRLAISVLQSPDPAPALRIAERAGVEDVLVVDIFGDRTVWRTGDPCILVHGRRDGRGRRARSGRQGIADVPFPGGRP